ncbi:putative voltage-dependent anion-selective channel [Caenorhabditis elegans]|uniref:Probable voltage-dependent anion-selective channel n=1 Tax=Caenorhabditis elegans TaxID=6239 RepID=VDAC_CAEEL|nr:putative voltage-dependent anion-selective channel [Caenorhabditis elegans]Q21752.2 RecName: Full=Probable voltage-dependent anion-selective channel [Caenorhabditis elegans]CCD71556.1 Probable voltage-dependent anion-selective channel [Caenorhabditis elegans]|eukprot:NP_501211.1 Probable voltage-dependent anion-selective channel [Caenorhabditis elegans]
MAPPTFADLGKSAKDLFNKGYNFGFLKIDSTTRAGDNKEVEFKSAASHNIGSGKLGGNLDVKYKIPQYGITLTEKWNTENQLGTVIEVNEQFGRGLKVTLDSLYAPHAGKRSGKVKLDWALPTARVTADVGVTSAPVINAAGVFSRDGWLIGAAATFDSSSNKLAATSLAFGHSTPQYTLHSFVINSTDFGASLYHKVASNVEVGTQLGWKVGGNGADYALATKYAPSRDLTVRAKVNSSSQVAVAATHSLSPALKLTLSTQFNLAANDAHKFGLGLEFDPSN